MLNFSALSTLITSVNNRGELSGQDREPAIDIDFAVIVANTVLDSITTGLKESLFSKKPIGKTLDAESQEDLDLADTNYPYLKFPLMDPFSWKFQQESYHMVVHGSRAKEKDLALTGTLKKLKIAPSNGGSVKISGQLQVHKVTERIAGRLGVLVQQQVDLSLVAPTNKELQALELAKDD